MVLLIFPYESPPTLETLVNPTKFGCSFGFGRIRQNLCQLKPAYLRANHGLISPNSLWLKSNANG